MRGTHACSLVNIPPAKASASARLINSCSISRNLLIEIDDLTRPDHYHLDAGDTCLFLGEYTARKGFSFSATNQLVLNFKKSVDSRGRPEGKLKERAIRENGEEFVT